MERRGAPRRALIGAGQALPLRRQEGGGAGGPDMFSRMGLSRRRFLAGALAVAGTGGAGCGGDDNEETPPEATGAATGEPAGEPKRGGTLRLATTALLGLDPHTAEGILLAANFYSAVIQATDWQGTVGDLAESWEVVDGLDWTFKVRSDVRFQDIPPVSGRPLVAEDIPRSIDRARSLPGSGEQFGQWLPSHPGPHPPTPPLPPPQP